MTVAEALAYLPNRLRRVCDALGNRQRAGWTHQDYEAVRALLQELERR